MGALEDAVLSGVVIDSVTRSQCLAPSSFYGATLKCSVMVSVYAVTVRTDQKVDDCRVRQW